MFIGAEKIRELTTFDDVAALSNSKLYSYIDRADAWIRRSTHNSNIESTEYLNIQKDLEIATLLLVEYLWYWDDNETKESAFSHEEQVRIGSYSYTKADPGDRTGISELDSILENLRSNPVVGNIFRISGPSRK